MVVKKHIISSNAAPCSIKKIKVGEKKQWSSRSALFNLMASLVVLERSKVGEKKRLSSRSILFQLMASLVILERSEVGEKKQWSSRSILFNLMASLVVLERSKSRRKEAMVVKKQLFKSLNYRYRNEWRATETTAATQRLDFVRLYFERH